MMSVATAGKLQFVDLGVSDYAEVLELQRRWVGERAQGLRPDTLILVEHPHVITRGTGFKGRTMGRPGVPVFDVERGGDVTYHGPGQLVGYPILHLGELSLSLSEYIRGLEDVLIDAVAPWCQAKRLPSFTGVWATNRKIASIGVAVRKWVTYHGFALNVNTDLGFFRRIYPCGLEPSQMTSLERLFGHAVPMNEVKSKVLLSFQKRFVLRSDPVGA